ncbi:MAG: hypothetical protein ACI9IJ_000938, partial [Psychromonas sp.]
MISLLAHSPISKPLVSIASQIPSKAISKPNK